MSHVERACRLSFSALLVLTLMTYHVDLNGYRTGLNKTRSPHLPHMGESESQPTSCSHVLFLSGDILTSPQEEK